MLEKFIYILTSKNPRTPEANRDCLLNECAPKLLELGTRWLILHVDDPFSTVKSPTPKMHRGPSICAQVSLFFEEGHDRNPSEEVLRNAGHEIAGYQVEESLYKDYGDNENGGPRDWPDGERSPAVVAITLLTKPKRFTHEEWIKRWHGVMSPVSERLQPRQRYMRNIVMHPVTPGAPAYDGMVEEAWPSAEHISNPHLFFSTDSKWQLIKNQLQILKAVMHFHNFFKLRTVTMSEYFIKTPFGEA